MMTPRTTFALGVLAAGLTMSNARPASAHPHVYVTVETTVLYDKGTISGLRQRWLFDEFYTTMAIEGLDTNGDGIYDRKELGELAKVNVEGLASMDYFTFAKLGSQRLAFEAPKDYWLDHVAIAEPPGPGRPIPPDGAPAASAAAPAPAPADQPSFWSKLVKRMTGDSAKAADAIKVLALEFTLPLKQPVLADAEGFEYSINDPGFWIWFDLASTKGATLGAGAPPGCKAEIGTSKQDTDVQRLTDSFSIQMNGQAGGSQPMVLGAAKTVSVVCAKP
jgi:ABC-type uncharacterized transport system substrate-binding protein